MEEYPFSIRIDKINRRDGLREVKPARVVLEGKYTVFYFPYLMFTNPRYSIPEKSEDLFKAYIQGGSRSYSSDGKIPALRAAIEAQAIIHKVRQIALNEYHPLNQKARNAIMKETVQREDWEVVRGTVGLLLGKWMPTDWQKGPFALKGYLNIDQDDVVHPWRAVMETLWRGGKDDIAHIIVVSQHAFAIAIHLRSVGLALEEHVSDFLDKNRITDVQTEEIYNKQTPISHKLLGSYNWEPFKRGSASTVKQMRKELYSFFLNQSEKRLNYASRLKTFANALVWALNKKFEEGQVRFVLTEKP